MEPSMIVDFKHYCNITVDEEISVTGFMKHFSFLNSKKKIVGLWTGKVLPYLLTHESSNKRNTGAHLKKIGRADLEIIIEGELQTRRHIRSMLPDVSKQQQAIGNLNTKLTERFVASTIRYENEKRIQGEQAGIDDDEESVSYARSSSPSVRAATYRKSTASVSPKKVVSRPYRTAMSTPPPAPLGSSSSSGAFSATALRKGAPWISAGHQTEYDLSLPVDRFPASEDSDNDDDDEIGENVLPHDFHGLFQALYAAANNQSLRIPKVPPMESTLKTTLFQYVKSQLTTYQDLPRIQQKDLYVAASSIAYLHCVNAKTIFKHHDLPTLLENTREPTMAAPSLALSDVLTSLKGQAQNDQGIFEVEQLVDLIDVVKGSLAKRRQTQRIDVNIKLAIDILQIVAPLCVADPIQRPVDTEQKSQAVWERIFNILFVKTAVTTVIGETGLEGSSKIRSQNEADYSGELHMGEKRRESPRKVDCKFVVSIERMKQWEFVTMSNSEMKALRSSADEVEVMVRKNIRHNHLIINKIGVPKIYFLNMHAYSASLMSLREHDGAFVCGKVLDRDLLIPTNALELECFLEGETLAALLSLRSAFLKVGRGLALQRVNSGSKDVTPLSMSPDTRTFYTPKKDKSMPSPKKSPPPLSRKRPMESSSSTSRR